MNALSEDEPVAYELASSVLAPSHPQLGGSLDLTSAYRFIELCPSIWVYFGIRVGGIFLIVLRLPFGLKQAPRLFVSRLALSIVPWRERTASFQRPR